jgi:transcriptional regulator with GAF, ATPase, and Fis domain
MMLDEDVGAAPQRKTLPRARGSAPVLAPPRADLTRAERSPQGEAMPEHPSQLREALARLSLLLLTEVVLRRDLGRILSVAQRSVPGCETASVTLLVEGQPRRAAAIDRIVVAIDLPQDEWPEGPCQLEAAQNRRSIRVGLLAVDERSSRFAEGADHSGVQSSLSVPLDLDSDVVGRLNLYSSAPDAFDATSQHLGASLASQVGDSVAKSAVLAAGQELAASAQQVADEHADIAVAHGMLMVVEQCSSEHAAALLCNAASSEAATLVGIARRIIAEQAGALEDGA